MEELKCLIKNNKINDIKSYVTFGHYIKDEDIKNNSFDLLIYTIKNTSSLLTVKTILNTFQLIYKDLNYSLDNGESPLAVALSFNRISLSDLLIERHADINYINNNGHSILYYLYFNALLSKTNLKFMLNHGVNLKISDYSFLFYIMLHNDVDFLKILYSKFKRYSRDFVLLLINSWKLQTPFSNDELQLIIQKETSKSKELGVTNDDLFIIHWYQDLEMIKLYFDDYFNKDFFNDGRINELLCELYINGQKNIVKYLINKGAPLNRWSEHSLLYCIVIDDDVDMAEFVIKKGAYINDRAKCDTSNYVIRYAIRSSQMLRLLIKLGADLFIPDDQYNKVLKIANSNRIFTYNITSYIGNAYRGNEERSTFCYACKNGNMKIVKHLLQTNVPNINKGLIYACKNGNPEIIKLLIDRGADVNYLDTVTPLEQACLQGDEKVVKLLLENGAKPWHNSTSTKSNLMLARECKNEKMIEYLVKYGAYVDEKDSNNETLLMYVCKNRFEKLARSILPMVSEVHLHDKDNNDNTALMYACQYGLVEIAQYLVDHGVEINEQNNNGETALILACKNGSYPIVHCLISHKADTTIIDNFGKSALIYALIIKKEDIVNELLSIEATLKGEVINHPTTKNGKSVLMYACKYSHKRLVEVLIEHHSEVNKRNNRGETALMYACKYGDDSIVSCLIDHGAEVNAISNAGDTTLMYGVQGLNVLTVILLMENQADWLKKNNRGETAMMLACKYGCSDVVDYLLDQGVGINDINTDGDTPLIYACKYGHKECVKLLLECDGSVDFKGCKGKTALMHACENGKLDIVKLLVSSKTNANIRDFQGKTALMYAREHNYGKITKYLTVYMEQQVNQNRKYSYRDGEEDGEYRSRGGGGGGGGEEEEDEEYYDEEEDDDYADDYDYDDYDYDDDDDYVYSTNQISMKLNKFKKKKVKKFEKKYANDNTSIRKIVNLKYSDEFYLQ